jgi:hypothetical protein
VTGSCFSRRTLPVEGLQKIDIPVLILNGKSDVANKKIAGFLKELPKARSAECGATITRHLTSLHFSRQ